MSLTLHMPQDLSNSRVEYHVGYLGRAAWRRRNWEWRGEGDRCFLRAYHVFLPMIKNSFPIFRAEKAKASECNFLKTTQQSWDSNPDPPNPKAWALPTGPHSFSEMVRFNRKKGCEEHCLRQHRQRYWQAEKQSGLTRADSWGKDRLWLKGRWGSRKNENQAVTNQHPSLCQVLWKRQFATKEIKCEN